MDRLARSVDEAIRTKDFATLSTIFSHSHGGWQSLGGGEQRSLAAHFIRSAIASSSSTGNHDDLLPAAFESADCMYAITQALAHLPAGPVENGADNLLRQMIFEYKVNEAEDYSGAAKILANLRMDDDTSSVYYMSPATKCDVYVKIAECFLEEDETVEADSAVTKAGSIADDLSNPEEHRPLVLRYKSTYARVLDANRKFLQAASRYYDLAQAHKEVDADDLLVMLGRAATCAILAQPGPQRQRILGLVFNDQRLSQLDDIPEFQTHSAVLKKMYMMQILNKKELDCFEKSLADHQKAVMGDGLTIVERAAIEHNILSVGRLYYNIFFAELGRLLGIDRVKAERVAAKMIIDGRLKASIDQVDDLLHFECDETSLTNWDHAITSVCVQLTKVADNIQADV